MTEKPRDAPAAYLTRGAFDANYYLDRYQDVRRAGVDPFEHYLGWGQKEGRAASPALEAIAPAVQMRVDLSPTPLEDILGLIPENERQAPEPSIWERLRLMIQPAFYAAQLDAAKNEQMEPPDVEQVFDHYVSSGAFDDLRVTILFHPQWYLNQLSRAAIGPPREGESPFFHWLTVGWGHQISPTPLFDEEYYRERHGDLRRWSTWLFLHYAEHGCYEGGRRPSAVVGPGHAPPRAKAERIPTLLKEVLSPQPGGASVDLRQTSHVEDQAIRLSQKVERLRDDKLQRLVDKAAAIEPLVLRPYGAREVVLPPVKHPMLEVKNRAETIRRDLPDTHFDTIVLAPHCRMAGSARVTGSLTHALRAIEPGTRAMVLTTDLSDFERPDWFHPDFLVFDLSAYIAELTPAEKVRVLLDVLRGLTPRRVVNVNSRVGWNLYNTFGKQLATLTELSAYLFTWDLDHRGNKGGYPVDSFYACFGFLSCVVVDNAPLREELISRYAMSKKLQEKLRVAYTPVSSSTIDHSSVFERRRQEGRNLRAIWAGRFDRQKRFDIVVEIAESLPELEIWAWGKAILGGLDIDFNALPPNVRLQGTYQEFDDLPFESSDFYLYTSEWDGLPTVLLDAGVRGVATVASSVGGVRDVLDETTGFPVHQALDASAYIQAIKEMVGDPPEVTHRARSFRSRVTGLCSEGSYTSTIAAAMAGGT